MHNLQEITNDPETESVDVTIASNVQFSMRNLPLLARGATHESLGTANNLWAHSKVYSTGGENSLHAHAIEDHCFLILQGEATFEFGDGSTFVARPHDGVLLPKGTRYRFVASPAGNLVMFRVGGAQLTNPGGPLGKYNTPQEIRGKRFGADGKLLEGEAKENGTPSEPVEILPGQFFSPG
ncbi:MAG: cupin domain-containing protein [Alcaligenaceae bacterium]